MKLNEFSAQKFDGTFCEFIQKSIQNNIILQQTKVQQPAIFTILNGFRILDSSIIHVNNEHTLTDNEWNIITQQLNCKQNIIKYDTGNKSKFKGNPIIYEIEYYNKLYGVLVEYFPKKLPIVVTAFQGTQTGIDNWFLRNKNIKNKKAHQDEGYTLRYRTGMLLGCDLTNIIHEKDENVNTHMGFMYLNNRLQKYL